MFVVPSGDLPAGLVVRRLVPSDSVTELTALLHRAYAGLCERGLRYVASHQDEETTRRRIAGGECFVGTVDDRLVGTITFKVHGPAHGCEWYGRPGVAYCAQLGVEPDLHGRGLGSLLLDIVEERAWQEGAAEIALDTSEQAVDLVDRYVRRGYRFVQEVDWAVTNYRSVVLSKPLALPALTTRPLAEGDVGILHEMLAESVNWDPARPRLSAAQTASRPVLRRYVEGWGRAGDVGIIAVDEATAPLAAAWFRYHSAADPGFGFVAESVPEVSIAVRRPWRGHGVGARLLHELEGAAGRAGIEALSLSVELSNPALRLYRRCGYRETAQIGGSYTMRLDVRAPAPGL